MTDYLVIFAPVLVWYGVSIVSGWVAGRLGASILEGFLIPFVGLPLVAGLGSLLSYRRRSRKRQAEFHRPDEDSKAE